MDWRRRAAISLTAAGDIKVGRAPAGAGRGDEWMTKASLCGGMIKLFCLYIKYASEC